MEGTGAATPATPLAPAIC